MSVKLHAMRLELEKLAEEPVEQQTELPEPTPAAEKKPSHPAWTVAKHLGAFGAGALGGQLLGMGVNEASRRLTGQKLIRSPAAAATLPIATGLGTVLFQGWQNNLMDQLREDTAKRKQMKRGG
jgi:hypothetical protein